MTDPVPGWGDWGADPVILAALVLYAAGYVWLFRRARRAPGGERLGIGHWSFFVGGMAILVVALVSPLNALTDRLLTAHMVQHVAISDLAPGLLLMGLRSPILPLGMPKAALRVLARGGTLGRIWGVLTTWWVALPLWAACQWIWAVPAMMDVAESNGALHVLQHATLFYSGILLWWIVVDPLPYARRRPHGGRLALLGSSRMVTAAVCLPMAFVPTVFYPAYANGPGAFGISGLADQQLAGAAMCFLEFLVFGIAFAVAFIDVLRREDRADALARRAARSEVAT